jgi:hypothetical protein
MGFKTVLSIFLLVICATIALQIDDKLFEKVISESEDELNLIYQDQTRAGYQSQTVPGHYRRKPTKE